MNSTLVTWHEAIGAEKQQPYFTQLRQRIADMWQKRTDRYSQLRHAATELPMKRIEMSYIGG